MLDEKLLAIILNLFYCLNAARLRNNRGECTYRVNVWHPSEDAEQKIRNLDYHWNNYTTYLTNELLMMKVASLNQIQQCRNTSNTIEKDMLQFRLQNERQKNDQLQFLHDFQTLKTKLDVVSKQTNSVKQELGRLRGRRGLRRHHSKQSKQLTLLKDDEGLELRNVVGNLKAEWLLMRRNLDSVQLENSNVKFGQNGFQTYINQIRQILDEQQADIGRLLANQSRLSDLANRTIKQVKELKYNIDAQRDDRKLNNDTVDLAKTVDIALSKTYRLEKQLSDVTIENTLMKHLLLSLAKGENVTAKIEKQLEKSYRYGNSADVAKDDAKRLTIPRGNHLTYRLIILTPTLYLCITGDSYV